MRHPSHAVVVACALAACHRTPSHPQPVAVTLPASSGTGTPVSAIDPCPGVEAHLRADLLGRVRELGDAGPRFGEPWTEPLLLAAIPPSGLGCVPFPSGAWFVEADPSTLDLTNDNEISAHVHFSASVSGKRAAPWGDVFVGYGGEPTTMQRFLLTDYDGDAVPELYVRTDEDGVEGGHSTETWILTVRQTASGPIVEPLAGTAALGEIGYPEDIDADGRPDFPVSLGVRLAPSGACDGKDDYTAADFLAHSLPDGRFSTDDAVAVGYAKRWCPTKPLRIATEADALCARLRASTPAEVSAERARVKASCVIWDCARERANLPQPKGADRACRGRVEAFVDEVPFHF